MDRYANTLLGLNFLKFNFLTDLCCIDLGFLHQDLQYDNFSFDQEAQIDKLSSLWEADHSRTGLTEENGEKSKFYYYDQDDLMKSPVGLLQRANCSFKFAQIGQAVELAQPSETPRAVLSKAEAHEAPKSQNLALENELSISISTPEQRPSEANREQNEESELSEKNPADLKHRADVVNKSLLRAVRKFFAIKFREEFPKRRYRALSKRVVNFNQNLDELFSDILASTGDSCQSESNRSMQVVLKEVIGQFVYPTLHSQSLKMSRKRLSPEALKFLKLFDSCCKFYSHREFLKVTSSRIFKEVLRLFMGSLTPAYKSMMKIFTDSQE